MEIERLNYIEKLNHEEELSREDVRDLIDYVRAHLTEGRHMLGAKEFHALERARSYIALTYDEEGGEEAAEAKYDMDQFDIVLRRLALIAQAPQSSSAETL